MRYAFLLTWFDRKRLLYSLLGVSFSQVLLALQLGILLGVLGRASLPIDRSPAQVWLTARQTPACDVARPLATRWRAALDRAGVELIEEYIQGYAHWQPGSTGTGPGHLVSLLGCATTENPIGPAALLTDAQRRLLTEPDTAIVDRQSARRLGIAPGGTRGQINRRWIRIVGVADDLTGLVAPHLIVSLPTARRLLPRYGPRRCSFLLGHCRDAGAVPAVCAAFQNNSEVACRTAADFANGSRWHWMMGTRGGLTLALVALLGLTIGVATTGQTLAAATAAQAREYATLRALGVSAHRIRLLVLQQTFLIAVLGVVLGLAATFLLAAGIRATGLPVSLPWQVLVPTCLGTLATATLAGLLALRALRFADPLRLLR